MRALFACVLILLLSGIRVAAAPQVTLSWQDNSNNESGFTVERGNGTQTATGTFIAIGTVSANSTAFVDTMVANSTTYSYRVFAFNAAGNSARSNVVVVTVPAPEGSPPSGPTNVNVEIPGNLVNVSNRGLVVAGDGNMIPGFVIAGGKVTVLIRAVGPTIGVAPYNVAGVCADPKFDLKDSSGATLASSDNWSGQATADAATRTGAFALPAGSKDAALVVTLPAGNYTVVVSGVGGATGVALAEIYALP